MRGYMDYLEELFLSYIGWNVNDSYANITLASQSVLDFDVPHGGSLQLSSQTTANTFTNYTISNLGVLKGSIAYIYSKNPAFLEPSNKTPLKNLVQCYRKYPLQDVQHNPGNYLYGRMFLPGKQLEAMYIQSLGVNAQLVAKWVVDPRFQTPVVLTTTLQSTSPKWTREFIYSSHENLLGFRMLSHVAKWSESNGTSWLDAGLELFYAANKKSPGASLGIKYSSRASYSAFPLAFSLVMNPLVGSASVAYTLKPTELSAFSSRFDFNFYSYLSDLTVGCELWRNTPISLQSQQDTPTERSGPVSVIKASTSLASQTAQVLWEGSITDFLASAGIKVCYGDRALPVTAGVEFIYSS